MRFIRVLLPFTGLVFLFSAFDVSAALKEVKGPIAVNVAWFEKSSSHVGLSDSFPGRNSFGVLQPSTHAEMNLMDKVEYKMKKKSPRHSKNMNKFGALVSISLAYSKKEGKWKLQNAHPCHHCRKDLLRRGVVKVKFSDPTIKTCDGSNLHKVNLLSPGAHQNARVSTGYRIRGVQTNTTITIASLETFRFLESGKKLFELKKPNAFILSLRPDQKVNFAHGHLTITKTIKAIRKHKTLTHALKKLGATNVLPALNGIHPSKHLKNGIRHYRSLYAKEGAYWISISFLV